MLALGFGWWQRKDINASIAQASKFAVAGRNRIVKLAGPAFWSPLAPRKVFIRFQKESATSSLPPAAKSLGTGMQARVMFLGLGERYADFHYGTVSLPSDYLAAAAEAISGRELPESPRKSTIRPPSGLMHRLLNMHKSIGRLAHDTPDILELHEVSRAFENELIHILVRCIADGHPVEPTTGSRRRDTIVARFVEFLEANPDRPLYLAEICAAIGVAERTLRASCEEHLGMGPIRYLTLRRMHLVRRALLHSDPSRATVTRIVTNHGFWELGRFSVAYRMLFGESPSETLRQPT
jgi:AraC-like DNA-binding protein